MSSLYEAKRRIPHSPSTRNPDVLSERESAYFVNTRENLFVRISILADVPKD